MRARPIRWKAKALGCTGSVIRITCFCRAWFVCLVYPDEYIEGRKEQDKNHRPKYEPVEAKDSYSPQYGEEDEKGMNLDPILEEKRSQEIIECRNKETTYCKKNQTHKNLALKNPYNPYG